MNYLEKIVSQSTVVDLDGRFDVVESDFNIEKPLRQGVRFRANGCGLNVTTLGPLDNCGRREGSSVLSEEGSTLKGKLKPVRKRRVCFWL